MYKLVVVAVLTALLAAGCHGGSNTSVDQPEPGAPDASLAVTANDLRMPVADDALVAGVEGMLTIEGFTIVDPDAPDGPAGASALTSQVPDMRLLVRLVDPEDDILSETFPDVGGRFALEYSGPVINAVLDVQFTVAEDLNGDGEGGDLLTHSVPVGLRPGRVAQVNLTLARQTAGTGLNKPLPGVADLELLPDTGELLLVSYSGQDGNGLHNEFYGVSFAAGQTIFDTDGDQFLETGDDVAGVDEDTDGWIDTYEADFSTAAEPQTVFGVVTNVSKANRTLSLAVEGSGAVLVLVDPFTPIEPLAPDDEFYGELPLDTGLIGRQVQVFGLPAPDGFLALWIVVLPPEPEFAGGM